MLTKSPINRASPDEYKMFATKLQHEYVHMDENTYKNMRLKVQFLNSFWVGTENF